MKFSKLLTTAMMSVALVASSSAFAAEETTWWSMDFNDLTIAEGGSLTNTLNDAYGTTWNGAWSTEEGDLSSLAEGKLVLNTQGTDLTWTPNGENNTKAITYIDADVTFVGSDTAPTISETDVHTAVFLKNNVDDTTGEVTNSVLCAWGTTRTDSIPKWYDLTGVEIKEKDENDNPISYGLRIMLDGENLTFYIDDVELTSTETIFSAKEGSSGSVDSVSFRGTGSIDNFAASQEVKEAAGYATIEVSALLNDSAIDESTYMWCDPSVIVESINLDETTPQAIRSLIPAVINPDLGDFVEGGTLSAMGVSINGGTERLIAYNKGFPTDDLFSFASGDYISVYIDPTALSKDDVVTVVFYYGTHTATEPDPDPVQLGTPDVEATTTETSVTLAWDAVANATGYEVTINDTTTTVTETTFTVSNLTASTDYSYSVVAKGDGVNYTDSVAATGTATTAAPAEPEPEFAPVAVAAIAIDGTTATLTIEGEYTEVKVLFCETLGDEWVEVEATFADGVATVPATTATGFFKVEAK